MAHSAVALIVLSSMFAIGCADRAAKRGRQLYAEHGCAVCHGAQGHGDGPSVKRLDIAPRDFADRRGYRNGIGPDQIAASIRNGAGAMPPFRDITESEAQDIAAWIVSLQAPEAR
jgi:high-affinity iron transporter